MAVMGELDCQHYLDQQKIMFSNSKSKTKKESCHVVSSSDSDATIDPGSDAEQESDATIEPDPQDFDCSQDLFSDPSEDEEEMASRLARQTTHVISDSGSDSETETKSSSKHHHSSHKSSHSSSSAGKSDSRRVSSGHHRESSSHSSSRDADSSRSKGHHHRSSSSKSISNSSQRAEKSSKSSVSSNGSGLFSDFLDLSSTDKTTTTPAKVTSTPQKVPTPKSAVSKKTSKLHDIFGSDSEESEQENVIETSPPDTSTRQDPNDLVPQPTSPSPPPMSSPSPPPSPSSVSSLPTTSAEVSSMSFDQALVDIDDLPASKTAKSKPPSSSSSSSSSSSRPSLPKSSTNSNSKSESHKSSSSSSTSSSKKEPVKDLSTNKSSSSSVSSESIPNKSSSSSVSSESIPNKSSSSSVSSESIPNKSSSSSVSSESIPNKRKYDDNSSSKGKPKCKYGSDCTRKNPLHWAEYEHFDESSEAFPSSKKQKIVEQGSSQDDKAIRKKYKEGQPFSFFMTQVKGIEDKYNSSYALDISEILSPAFGNIQASCQFNFMIDIAWLVQQYCSEFRKKPLLIVHGFTGSQQKGLQNDASKFSHISLCQARLEIPYGTHHSKMMFLLYDNGMRVVIHTANLIKGDWHQKTQALWMSPLFPKLKCGANKNEGHSATSFKKDLLQYVAAYKNSSLTEWERNILEHDMSAAKVHLIASVPGRHTMLQKNAWGHLKLRKVLIDNGPEKMEVDSWPLIGQFSSIGSLGASSDNWLCSEFYQSLAACRATAFTTPHSKNLKLIYPSVDNVRVSLEGYPGGTCLPYSIQTASKQSYLTKFLHRWRSEGRGRSRACPHVKSYMRTSPDYSMAAWFVVTSANLSKAAWGVLEKNGSQLMIRSYEIGIMFLPNLFDVRRLKITSDMDEAANSEKSMFLLPYDVPLTSYSEDDSPWIYDLPYKDLPDTNGMMWCPSL